MTTKLLEGKKALITGSRRGIGAGIAQLFAEHGADVGINDITRDDEADKTIASIEAMDDCSTFILFPLLGGMDPAFAWEGLKLFEQEVWPHVRHRAQDMLIPGI